MKASWIIKEEGIHNILAEIYDSKEKNATTHTRMHHATATGENSITRGACDYEITNNPKNNLLISNH